MLKTVHHPLLQQVFFCLQDPTVLPECADTPTSYACCSWFCCLVLLTYVLSETAGLALESMFSRVVQPVASIAKEQKKGSSSQRHVEHNMHASV